VRFHHVTFGYKPGRPVLKGVDLYAKPGQKIAFVGSTGAGKTTVANLINRFYDVTGGSIIYDGIDIRDIKKDDLRRSVAVVLQDTNLFTGTIAENIAYGNPCADRAAIEEAARLANADSFIRRLPDGYDTMLTGNGANLSQGSGSCSPSPGPRFRPAGADPGRGHQLRGHPHRKADRNGYGRLMENRTVFVIAHRLSTVRNAKAIIVMEKRRDPRARQPRGTGAPQGAVLPAVHRAVRAVLTDCPAGRSAPQAQNADAEKRRGRPCDLNFLPRKWLDKKHSIRYNSQAFGL
jgi:ATP-binding cassette subfamily B protein